MTAARVKPHSLPPVKSGVVVHAESGHGLRPDSVTERDPPPTDSSGPLPLGEAQINLRKHVNLSRMCVVVVVVPD